MYGKITIRISGLKSLFLPPPKITLDQVSAISLGRRKNVKNTNEKFEKKICIRGIITKL